MSTKKEKTVTPVGVDDGYAYTKVALYTSNGIQLVKIPSRLRVGINGPVKLSGGYADGTYKADGRVYTVRQYGESENTRFDGYHSSPMNRVLVHHALIIAGLNDRQLDVASGLPLSDYFKSGANINDDAIKQKQDNLKKPVEAIGGEKNTISISNVHVYSQAVAAAIDYIVNEKGEVIDDRVNQTIGVIDVGGSTTDYALITPGPELDMSHSGTDRVGVLDVQEALGQVLSDRFGGTLSSALLEMGVETGYVKVSGEKISIKKELSEIIKEVIEHKIIRGAESRFGKALEVDKLLLVGGGASIFEDALSRYKQIFVPSQPEFANARGMLKFLTFADK